MLVLPKVVSSISPLVDIVVESVTLVELCWMDSLEVVSIETLYSVEMIVSEASVVVIN